MRARFERSAILFLALLAYLLAALEAAKAGGVAVREQSISGMGSAFAGVAAGSDLSTIFWNSAGASIARRGEGEVDATLFIPSASIRGASELTPIPELQPVFGPSLPLNFLDPDSGTFMDPAPIPSLYAAEPLSKRWSFGLGFNAPFGLVTEPSNRNWVGKFEAESTKFKTYNLNPVVSYTVMPDLVLGAGIQLEYVRAGLKAAFPGVGGLAGPNPNLATNGDDFGVGYTLGLLWRPFGETTVGAGFRSGIEHTLDGHTFVPGYPNFGKVNVSTAVDLPAIATVSLRQGIGKVTLLGTVEWTDSSVVEQLVVAAKSNDPALGAVAGQPLAVIPLNWHNGWYFAGGAEYAATSRLALRAGGAYEVSPIQSATERFVRLPDSNRIILALGGSYMLSGGTTVSLAYEHIFFEDSSIDRTSTLPGLGDVRLHANVDAGIDCVGLSVRFALGSSRQLD